MNTDLVIRFYGTKAAIARELDISPEAVTRWGDIVPEKRAARLSHITGGELQYDPSFYENNDKAKRSRKMNNENQTAD